MASVLKYLVVNDILTHISLASFLRDIGNMGDIISPEQTVKLESSNKKKFNVRNNI